MKVKSILVDKVLEQGKKYAVYLTVEVDEDEDEDKNETVEEDF